MNNGRTGSIPVSGTTMQLQFCTKQVMAHISADVTAAKHLAAYILDKSNLKLQWEDIFYSIEEDLRETYSEDELTDTGNIYVLYKALEEGQFSKELEEKLTAEQKKYLSTLCLRYTLEFKIIRRDCLVNRVTIPLHLGGADGVKQFNFHITVEASLDADEIHAINGEYFGISKEAFLKYASTYLA